MACEARSAREMGRRRPSSHTPNPPLDSQVVHIHPTRRENTKPNIDAITIRDQRFETLQEYRTTAVRNNNILSEMSAIP